MGLKKISKDIPYTRYIPDIFGKSNIYEFNDLLAGSGTSVNRFIAQTFSGTMIINQENTIGFYPQSDVDSFHALAENNEEIHYSELLAHPTTKGEKVRDVVVPLMRPGFDIYGHWLLDLLPKLAVFERLNPQSKYMVIIDDRCAQWVVDLISMFFHNFTSIKKIAAGETISGEFFLTSPIRHHDFISEMCKIDIGTKNNNPAPDRKIYISRKHLHLNHRQLENIDQIEKLFRKKGFELVHPEELSIHEQAKMFSETAILAGEAGSGLHNSIFCSKGTKIINIQSGRQNHFIQASLCHQYGQDVIYVSGRSKTNDWGSSFKAGKRDCKRAIKRAISLL